MIDKVRKYMALLTVYENNFRVLHWKVFGPDFNTIHERYGDYYDHLGTMLDEVAEQLISLGGNPVNSKEALSILESSDINAIIIDPTLDYNNKTADTAASNMFAGLQELSSDLCDEDDDDMPFEIQDTFIQHSKYYNLENKFKLARTLKE